jgi:hypothetical protein
MKINWIQKLYNVEFKAQWKSNIEHYFKEDIKEIIKSNLAASDYPEFRDKFYTDMWQTWSEISNKEPNNIDEICNQRICNNPYLELIAGPY